jgi:UDPglucose 6-dehydrogenase
VAFAQDEFEAVSQADGLILATEWNDYRNLDLARVKGLMRGNCIVDARNLLDPRKAREVDFHYQGVGR